MSASYPSPPPFQKAPAQPDPAMYLDLSGTPSIPFWRLVKVELRKALDTSAGFWLLVAIAVLIIIVEGFLLVVGLTDGESTYELTLFTIVGGYLLQPLLPIVVAMQVTSEWSQRTAMVTFATEPRRLVVVYAKLVAGGALALLMTAVLFVVALTCLLILSAFQVDVDWGTSLSGTLGLLVFLSVAIAVAFAASTLLLNTPATIVTFLAVIYAVPAVVGFIGVLWRDFREVGRHLNLQGAINPVLRGTLDTGEEWSRLIVSVVVWVVVPVVLGMTRILRAEVK